MQKRLRAISRIATVVVIVVVLIVAAAAGLYAISIPKTTSLTSTTSSSTFSTAVTSSSSTLSTSKVVTGTTPIVIGCSADLSGALSSAVVPVVDGFAAAQAYVNQVLGGVYLSSLNEKFPLNIQCYDDESAAANAEAITERLIAQNVSALLGASGSGVATGYMSTVESAKVPLLATYSFADKIWDLNYTYAWCQCPKSSQLYAAQTIQLLQQLAATHAPKFTTAAYVYDGLGNPNIQVGTDAVIPLMTSMGVQNVYNESIPDGLASYASVTQAIAAAKPQFLYAYIQDLPTAVEVMKELSVAGVHPLLTWTYVGNSPGGVQSLGSLALNTLTLSGWNPTIAPVNESGVAQQLSFFLNYSNTQGWSTTVRNSAANGFGGVMTLVEAIEAAGSVNHDAINAALANKYYTLWGPWEPGQPTHVEPYYPSALAQIQMLNGTEQAVPIYPPGAPGTYTPSWA